MPWFCVTETAAVSRGLALRGLAMADRSESEPADRWRRTPSRARERSRSSLAERDPTATGSAGHQRGEAPDDPGTHGPESAEFWPKAAGKGRGGGHSCTRDAAGKAGKRGKGKYAAFAGRGGKAWWQRGEAPAIEIPPEEGAASGKNKGKGKQQDRLEEGEILRCVWPAAPGETFRREGNYSLQHVLDTAKAMGGNVEIRGRERKHSGLQRIMVVTAPPGQADALFLFIRSAARVHNNVVKLPQLTLCTRAEVNVDGVLVHTLRGGTTPPLATDQERWLEFMKEPLPHDFSSDSELSDSEQDERQPSDSAQGPAPSAASATPEALPDVRARKGPAWDTAVQVAAVPTQQSPRGEAPGARRGEAPEQAAPAPTQGGAVSAEDLPENRAQQEPAARPPTQPFGPPPAAPGEPTSVLLPPEEVEQLPQETFHDAIRAPRPLFLQETLTQTFQTCVRFAQAR